MFFFLGLCGSKVKEFIKQKKEESIEDYVALNELETAYDFFKIFQSDEWIKLVVEQSKLYARQNNVSENNLVHINEHSIRTFDAVVLHSGYNPVVSYRMMWEQQPDCHNAFVASAIPRDKFYNIIKNLHLVDNATIVPEHPDADRFVKVRPIFDNLNKAGKYFLSEECYSVDEAMVQYYGRHGCNQYIANKPTRYGFKVWTLATSDGAGVCFEPYCGASTRVEDLGLGQGPNVVLDLIKKSKLRDGSKIYFDNLFTSFPLLKELSRQGYGGTGTVRQDRLNQVPLPPKKIYDKKVVVRGTAKSVYSEDIVATAWKDTKGVYTASNVHSGDLTKTCQRYIKEMREDVNIKQPEMVHSYNQHMGGVDLLDSSVKVYFPEIRNKKWWWPFYAWHLSVCSVNAWRLRQKVKGIKEPYLDFLRELCLGMVGVHGQDRILPPLKTVKQFDTRNHWPVHLQGKKRRNCKHCTNEGRPTKSVWFCEKCDVGLHLQCFKAFHT